MTLHRFQLFMSIAKHLSISQASRELHISQPAVSKQLKALQEDFGIRLFKKIGRGIQLTQNGLVFRRDVESILAQVEGMNKKYRVNPDHQGEGRLTLGASPGPSITVLPALMTIFRKSHPGVELSLQTGSSAEIQYLVLKSRVDVAVIVNPKPSPSLQMEPFRKEQLAAFVPSDHSLGKKGKIKFNGLAQLSLVMMEGRQGENRTEEILSSLRDKGLSPNVAMRCESPEAVKEAVRRGAGMGILDRDLVARDVRRGEFKIVELPGVNLAGQSYIVYSNEKSPSSTAQEFLALLRAARKKRVLNKRTLEFV